MSCIVLVLATAIAATSAACARAPREAVSPPVPAAIDTLALRAHTSALAHDSMQGRGTGTVEKRMAAAYIGQQLRRLGLTTLDGARASSPQDYFVPVPLRRVDVAEASLTIDGESFRHGAGWLVGRFGHAGLHDASGPVVTLGADSSDVEAGAWLLLERSPGEALIRWLPVWRERGVIGLITRVDTDEAFAGWVGHLGHTRWQLAEGADPIWQADLPILMVGPGIAAQVERDDARVTFEPRANVTALTDYNVVGVLPGTDPDADPVFMTAHYDHLGVRRGVGADSIYNGFSDNAAGVAMLLAIAESIRPAPPARPLIFFFAAAEEVGLLGSIHFASTHEDLVQRTHALVNLDAGAPPAAATRWRLAGGTRSAAGAVAAQVIEARGWAHRSDGGAPNSDYWPFMMRGVPSIFLIPDGGFEGVTEAEATALVQRWDHYHRAEDHYSPEFPFVGLERYAELARAIVFALAQAELER
ncbi:MAG TPA: M28 family peptidase [Longimicrobiales bacterium]